MEGWPARVASRLQPHPRLTACKASARERCMHASTAHPIHTLPAGPLISRHNTCGFSMKCAGRWAPCITSPSRAATSLYTSDMLMGMPLRCASTESMHELSGL